MRPIIDYIRALVDGGHAYEAGGDVYFRVRSDQRLRQPLAPPAGRHGPGRGRGGRRSASADPLDFALWKAHKPGEDTSWESPVG